MSHGNSGVSGGNEGFFFGAFQGVPGGLHEFSKAFQGNFSGSGFQGFQRYLWGFHGVQWGFSP